MTQAEQLAEFVTRASYGDLSEAARQQLKIRVLDALGCALGASAGEPIRLVRAQIGIPSAWRGTSVGEGEGGYNEDHEYFGELANI